VKAAVDEQLSLRQLWRKVELAPDVLADARKYSLGSLPISLPIPRQVKNALQVSPGAPVPCAFLGLAQSLMNKVLDQNRLLAMRSIAGWCRLKIETDRAIRTVALKLRQLPDIFAGNHYTLLVVRK